MMEQEHELFLFDVSKTLAADAAEDISQDSGKGERFGAIIRGS